MTTMTNERKKFPIELEALSELEFGLDEIVAAQIRAATPSEHPFLVHMLGVPGCGKSTVAQKLHSILGTRPGGTSSILGFDRVMMEIDGYQNLNLHTAFAKFEMPARKAGYAILEGLIASKASIVFDHGGSAPEHPSILKFAKELFGYTTVVINVQVNLEEAKRRIAIREKVEDRHTPAHYVDDRLVDIRNLIPSYFDQADAIFNFNNSSSEPNEILIEQFCNKVADFLVS